VEYLYLTNKQKKQELSINIDDPEKPADILNQVSAGMKSNKKLELNSSLSPTRKGTNLSPLKKKNIQ